MSATATGAAWQTRCEELAPWTMSGLVNRKDRHGSYGDRGPFTAKDLTESTLNEHFAGWQLIGLHSTSAEGTCRWLGLDFDNHDEDPDIAAANFDAAMRITNQLTELGVTWLLEDSDGQGGYHIWVLFASPVPAKAVHRFGQWLVGDDDIEIFPKQSELTGKGLGNWLRLPGRHHTRGHWSRFWGDGEWLDYDESVELLLSAPTNDPICLRHAPVEPDEITAQAVTETPGNLTGIDLSTLHQSATRNGLITLAEQLIEQEPWENLLVSEGWQPNGEHKGTSTWIRPGKNAGVSGKLNFGGKNLFHVFTTNAGMPAGKSYGKFRFWMYSQGFDDSRQIEAAKAYLPADVVEADEQQWRRSRDAGNGDPAEISPDRIGQDLLTPVLADNYTPFPTDLLPDVLRRFVCDSAASSGGDPVMTLMPALAVCATAIGNSRSIKAKRDWIQPSLLWTVTIGDSGTMKSPPIKHATAPLHAHQVDLIEQSQQDMAQYKAEMGAHKQATRKWEKDPVGLPPIDPTKPPNRRCIVSNATIQSIGPILQENPRGLLLSRDELSGWFASFNQFNGSNATISADGALWCEAYDASTWVIDRATNRQFLFIPAAYVSVTGTIQPSILGRAITDEFDESGLAARLLMAYPPKKIVGWRDTEMPTSSTDNYARMISGLFELKPTIGEKERQAPSLITLSAGAKDQLVQFVNQHADEHASMSGTLARKWGKLKALPLRLALVIHCVRQVSEGDHWSRDQYFESDAATMDAAIRMTGWFKSEAIRIHGLMTEPEEVRDARQLVLWITEKHGGEITPRDLARCRRDVENVESAENKLVELQRRGCGTWVDIHKSRKFVISDSVSPNRD
jgi:hypothetical protein